jgi:hypothetical protein
MVFMAVFSRTYTQTCFAIMFGYLTDSLTLNICCLYKDLYLPWRFGAKVRGGPLGPPLLYPGCAIAEQATRVGAN